MFGLDVGNLDSALAILQGAGADTLPNSIGSRVTPTIVSYGERQRSLGDEAAGQRRTNSRNTLVGLPSLLGRCAAEDDVARASTEAGGDAVRVSYGGRELTVAVEAVLGAYIGGFVRLARDSQPVAGQEPSFVLAVPSYFTVVQRHALAHAGAIAGARVAQLCDETVATALFYAHERLSGAGGAGAPSQAVLFVDCGHCHTTAFVVFFDQSARALRVIDSETVLVGGRDLDALLAQKFEREIQEQKGVEITSARAKLRLLLEAEKAKKVLSANSSWSTMIEELQEGLDFAAAATRDELCALCEAAGLLARLSEGVTALLLRVLTSGALGGGAIAGVELFGGCARVPAVSSAILEVVHGMEGFGGVQEGRSLNGAESVARGCALYGASMGPDGHGLMRVQHSAARQMSLRLGLLTPSPATAADEAEAGSPMDVDRLVDAATPQAAEGGSPAFEVARGSELPFIVGGGGSEFAVDPSACAQGLVRLVLTVEEQSECTVHQGGGGGSAGVTVLVYAVGLTEAGEAAMQSADGAPPRWPLQVAVMGNDGNLRVAQPASPAGAALLQLRPLAPDVPAAQQQPLLSGDELQLLVEQERAMHAADLEVGRALEEHNRLETQVYGLRETVRLFATEAEAASTMPELQRIEDWLYAEGAADAPAEGVTSGELCEMYAHKSAALAALCAPCVGRAEAWGARRDALLGLLNVLEVLRGVAIDPTAAAKFRLSTKQAVAVGASVSAEEAWLSDHGLPNAAWEDALAPEPRTAAAAREAAERPEVAGLLSERRQQLEAMWPAIMEGERARGIAIASELLQADKAAPRGTVVAVDGHGEGIYESFTSRWVGANEHTINFRGEGQARTRKVLKLRDMQWRVVSAPSE